MTTIAYKAGIMAADSRVTASDRIWSNNAKKISRLANGAVLGEAGSCDCRDVVDLLSKATPDAMPSRAALAATKTDFTGLVVFPDGRVFEVFISPPDGANGAWDGAVYEVHDPWAAIGSGGDIALTAMRLGHSAVEAVKHAITEDPFSGGAVQHMAIATKRKRRTRRG